MQRNLHYWLWEIKKMVEVNSCCKLRKSIYTLYWKSLSLKMKSNHTWTSLMMIPPLYYAQIISIPQLWLSLKKMIMAVVLSENPQRMFSTLTRASLLNSNNINNSQSLKQPGKKSPLGKVCSKVPILVREVRILMESDRSLDHQRT
jgi:hypothetical protein